VSFNFECIFKGFTKNTGAESKTINLRQKFTCTFCLVCKHLQAPRTCLHGQIITGEQIVHVLLPWKSKSTGGTSSTPARKS